MAATKNGHRTRTHRSRQPTSLDKRAFWLGGSAATVTTIMVLILSLDPQRDNLDAIDLAPILAQENLEALHIQQHPRRDSEKTRDQTAKAIVRVFPRRLVSPAAPITNNTTKLDHTKPKPPAALTPAVIRLPESEEVPLETASPSMPSPSMATVSFTEADAAALTSKAQVVQQSKRPTKQRRRSRLDSGIEATDESTAQECSRSSAPAQVACVSTNKCNASPRPNSPADASEGDWMAPRRGRATLPLSIAVQHRCPVSVSTREAILPSHAQANDMDSMSHMSFESASSSANTLSHANRRRARVRQRTHAGQSTRMHSARSASPPTQRARPSRKAPAPSHTLTSRQDSGAGSSDETDASPVATTKVLAQLEAALSAPEFVPHNSTYLHVEPANQFVVNMPMSPYGTLVFDPASGTWLQLIDQSFMWPYPCAPHTLKSSCPDEPGVMGAGSIATMGSP
ncbi:uncharacterized protein MONBRDRAFT_6636 [Monosiga brevicollis MX1]|uniref:Uncharacterized protein n=1 Tax=Monosiga brevicollis TaxID=81824 RepID=A9UUV0_MONBE|nr:uncharacterized protein MONBRDRAFT_6636 [Monosiga brevicollis MX1]EDQ90970.1 predicted protein [Monosiga brevicollis MX1]|eukprot:XP_001744267.1 hypothetical protein [Monosiga brevicollis MX1]